jgi:hypothetical protein
MHTHTCKLAAVFIGFGVFPAAARDVTIGVEGRVSLELIGSNADFANTLSIVATTPTRAIRILTSGCQVEPASGLPGLPTMSEKRARRGCRVVLDANESTQNLVEGFPAGTTFELGMCVKDSGQPACRDVWSSNPSKNTDSFDHLMVTDLNPTRYPGQAFRLNWEDTTSGGDRDFNDLIAVLRVELDSDGDGLWDDWETQGIDTDGDGTIDLDLPHMGANPLRKDMYIEIDFMGCSNANRGCRGGHDHRPSQTIIDKVVEAFDTAPVDNPVGRQGISLHLLVSSPDDGIPHADYLSIGCGGPPGPVDTNGDGTPDVTVLSFDDLKADSKNFGPNNPRRFAFRYAIFAHRQHPDDKGSSGCGELFGNDFLVTLGAWDRSVGTVNEQVGTFMHELGHTLGLAHGGGDGTNDKPNYLSVMNYRFQTVGVPLSRETWTRTYNSSGGFQLQTRTDSALLNRFDYSRFAMISLDENDLDENTRLDAPYFESTDIPGLPRISFTRYQTGFKCPAPPDKQLTVYANEAADWNCDSRLAAGVSSDLNGDSVKTVLTSFNDWSLLKYNFQSSPNFEDGVHPTLTREEITPVEVQTRKEATNGTPVAVIAQTPEQVLTREVRLDASGSLDPEGAPLTYSWRVVSGSAALSNANSAQPIVQFAAFGRYVLELTVQDAAGLRDTASVAILYAGR